MRFYVCVRINYLHVPMDLPAGQLLGPNQPIRQPFQVREGLTWGVSCACVFLYCVCIRV